MQKQALIVIDVQNDYFSGGQYPLWNVETVLQNVEVAIARARSASVPVVLIQHVADPAGGAAPFFNEGSSGASIHPRILSAAPDAIVVVKRSADAFLGTDLEPILSALGVSKIVICGMMTQHCVTHTAISKSAEKYEVTVLGDCCTTVDSMIHRMAMGALSARVAIAGGEAFPASSTR